jgi:hypothetical protein
MGFLRQLFGKSSSSGLKFKSEKSAQKAKGVNWQGIEEQKTQKTEDILKNVDYLLSKYPESPDFLGSKVSYPKKKRRFFRRIRRVPNISGLREEVNRFSESKEVLDPRTRINKLLKRFPYYADLRAVKGIQIYNDALQSGLDSKKLDVLEDSLVEISGAVCNQGLSIFNVGWFLKIYLRYLDMLKDKYSSEYKVIKDSEYREVRAAAEGLNRAILQTTSLLSIRDKLGGLTMLNAKLKGSVYITSTVSQEEIRLACTASLQNDLTRTISEGKTANYVLLVVMTLGLLVARVPIFKRMVADLLKGIPDITKDLILQKNMINTMIIVTDFQIALSSGDADASKLVSDKLYNRCKTVIGQHLEYSILTKPHEVDPFLKAAWIAKESSGLIRESEYRVRLEEASQFLKKITSNQGKVKGAYELARSLQNDINFIMAEYGWSTY